VSSPLAVDVLMHHRERFRPSSTGNLIQRVLPGSRQHLWRRERRLTVDEVRRPGRELWILHPHGELAASPPPPAAAIQLVLLDGSWREASAMAQEVRGWGRTIRLTPTGGSRYWLRAQADAARLSTVEALLAMFAYFELAEAHAALRLQFELHVYASLRARGHKAAAREFLASSPVTTAFPELIAALDVRRSRD
jgi:DTW domain-containing protein YfiP